MASCLTGLDLPVLQIKTKIVGCYTANSKTVNQEVNGTVILPPLVYVNQMSVGQIFFDEKSSNQPCFDKIRSNLNLLYELGRKILIWVGIFKTSYELLAFLGKGVEGNLTQSILIEATLLRMFVRLS